MNAPRRIPWAKILKYVRRPALVFFYLGLHGHFKFIPDELYVRICYRILMGKRLELDPPRTFNEKLQWLKLRCRRPEQTRWVDKYEVRKLIADQVGERHLFPLLGVWDRVEDVDWAGLPEQFVLKCTHDSNGTVICRDKSRFDERAARRKLAACLKRNYYWAGREWAYKDVPPRIIAEPLMVDESGTELKDYKFFCFDGEPRLIQVDFDRFRNHKRNLYDPEWRYQPFQILFPTDPGRVIPRPANLDDVLAFVRRITPKVPFMRTDLYLIGERIYFGEFTLHHGGGAEKFTPESYDMRLGEWIRLPEIRRPESR